MRLTPEEELRQYEDVAGCTLYYPNGRRLPDSGLSQGPAFMAFILGRLEEENKQLLKILTLVNAGEREGQDTSEHLEEIRAVAMEYINGSAR